MQFYLELLMAAKRELVRFRFYCVVAFSLALVIMIVVAIKWPQKYVSSAIISVDFTNVIEPLLRGAAEVADVDVNEKVADVILSRRVLERAVYRLTPDATAFSPQRLEGVVKRMRRGMEVEVSRRRPVTTISFTADNADTAYDTLKAVVEVFLEDRAAEKQKDSYEAYSFISEQVVEYKKQLELAETRLKAFKSQSVDASEGDVRRRISQLTAEMKDLQVVIQETEETIATTKGQLVTEGRFIEVRSKNAALEARRRALQDDLDRLRLSYQDSYPDIVTLKARIGEISSAIADNLKAAGLRSSGQVSELPLYEELRKQVSSNEVQLVAQRRRLEALGVLLNEEGALADQVAEQQAELLDLTRDYDVTKGVYEEMLGRKENAKLTMALNNEGQGENYKLVEPPIYPLSPSGLNPLIIFAVAPFLALGFPLGLILAYVFLDPRIRSAQLLEEKLPEGVELLGAIPHQSTPIAVRLMRKDMLLVSAWMICVMAVYGYLLVIRL